MLIYAWEMCGTENTIWSHILLFISLAISLALLYLLNLKKMIQKIGKV